MRLSVAGSRLARSWGDDGIVVGSGSEAADALAERLVDAGMAVPVPALLTPAELAAVLEDLTVIVPVFERVDALDRCLKALRNSGVRNIVVCDDASPNGDEIREVCTRHDARVVRRGANGGPAAARMTGWVSLERPDVGFIAFVDSDVEVSPSWLHPLLGLFGDERVALAAPRVAHLETDGGVLDRYEEANSPLDLGGRQAAISAGTRVSYVPAAALVVSGAAFSQVDGFDRSLSVGEDVDLCWRLVDSGWRCRYEPASVVEHRGRSSLGAMLARRIDYGRSAAQLDRRHRGALPPLRANVWSLAAVAALGARRPGIAVALTAWAVRSMSKRLDDIEPRIVARLVLSGDAGAGRQLARALVRPWLPVTLVAGAASRRIRRVAMIAVAVDLLWRWAERSPRLDPVRFGALCLLDDAAYTLGVWIGCVREGRIGVLLPEISMAAPGSAGKK